MRTQWLRRLSAVAVTASFLAGGAVATTPAAASAIEQRGTGENWYHMERTSELLGQLQLKAGQLSRNADMLERFNKQPHISWQSHTHYLHQVRTNINEAGGLLRELETMKASVAPWQQLAIERTTRSASAAARHAELAIRHLNQKGHVLAPEYREHLAQLSTNAAEMKSQLDDFLKYQATKQQLREVQQRLDVENL